MKNIHVLPTDKPSRLSKNTCFDNVLELWGKDVLSETQKDKCIKDFNLYITSDEEIKDGEYGISLNLVKEGFKAEQAVFKMDVEQRDAMEWLGGQEKAKVFKVILTTDPELIADDVQAIDDTFLEWFCENSSCEWVEVGKIKNYKGNYFDCFHRQGQCDCGLSSCKQMFFTYKIIIPKEEPKQETLEEAALKYASEKLRRVIIPYKEFNANVAEYVGFVNGAKWQQEQNKKLYTEEEVKQILIECCSEVSCEDGSLVGKTPAELYKWIEERFKKK